MRSPLCVPFVLWLSMLGCDRGVTETEGSIAASPPPNDAASTSGERLEARPDCPPARGCEVLGRYEVGSAAAVEQGFTMFTVDRGAVSCDPDAVYCEWRGVPASATIVATSPACGLWGDFLLMDAKQVYRQQPQSIGTQGGPGWALVAIQGADPSSYEPLPHGFGRDASRVYDHGEPLDDADVRTFEVLDCPNARAACDAARCW